MPERILTTSSTLAGCLLHGAAYGACLRLLGMPVDALLLGVPMAVCPAGWYGCRRSTTRLIYTNHVNPFRSWKAVQ